MNMVKGLRNRRLGNSLGKNLRLVQSLLYVAAMESDRMKTDWIEKYRAIFASKKFTHFLNGVTLTLPNGKEINLKVEDFAKRPSAEGFQFSKHSFITRTTTSEGRIGTGYGEGEDMLLAFQKSIAESIERAVFFSCASHYSETSSGWAVHLSQKAAQRSALNELLERDAVLCHWLTSTPFYEIEESSFPSWSKAWTETELKKLNGKMRLLFAHAGHVPVILCVLRTDDGKTFVAQGASKSLESAIYHAMGEACRIASSAHAEIPDFQPFQNPKATPWDHAMAYASGTQFPKWAFGARISLERAKRIQNELLKKLDTKKIAPHFKTIRCGGLYISQCTSNNVQSLFFGKNEDAESRGLINHARLKEIKQNFVLNPQFHCVP